METEARYTADGVALFDDDVAVEAPFEWVTVEVDSVGVLARQLHRTRREVDWALRDLREVADTVGEGAARRAAPATAAALGAAPADVAALADRLLFLV